jgi:hypothetical protein
VSDLFIAIVWVNHRYPVRYAADATPRLLCFNFVRSGAIVALKYPLAGPGICIACLALYLRPDPPEATTKKASREKPSRDA